MKVKPIESFAIMAIGDMTGSQLVCKEEPVRKLEKENEVMRNFMNNLLLDHTLRNSHPRIVIDAEKTLQLLDKYNRGE